jgi:hypothetical protein
MLVAPRARHGFKTLHSKVTWGLPRGMGTRQGVKRGGGGSGGGISLEEVLVAEKKEK